VDAEGFPARQEKGRHVRSAWRPRRTPRASCSTTVSAWAIGSGSQRKSISAARKRSVRCGSGFLTTPTSRTSVSLCVGRSSASVDTTSPVVPEWVAQERKAAPEGGIRQRPVPPTAEFRWSASLRRRRARSHRTRRSNRTGAPVVRGSGERPSSTARGSGKCWSLGLPLSSQGVRASSGAVTPSPFP
jgi:hypothetical protein